MFNKIKDIFGKKDTEIKTTDVTKNAPPIDCQHCPIDRKFESMYYNMPIGMVTISLDDNIIENYNVVFSSLLANFYYPHGLGRSFSDIVFKSNKEEFKIWISNLDETAMAEGIDVKLVRDKMGNIDIPILTKLNKLLISKQENIIVLSVINIDSYLNEDLRLEEEKYLLEKNNCSKNKVFIDTFAELKIILTKFVNHEEDKIETEKLQHVLTMVDRVLNYYKHNPSSCPYCSIDSETGNDIAERIKKKFENVRILLVDDMEINLNIVSSMLSSFVPTCIVDKAMNGQQALDLIQQNTYDIVLIDLVMPEMDGYEAIEKLRDESSEYHVKDLPIVVLTALSHKSDKDRALTIGVNDYLTKPVNPRELVRILEKWV